VFISCQFCVVVHFFWLAIGECAVRCVRFSFFRAQSQEIGSVWNGLFCVEWNVKPQLSRSIQSVSLCRSTVWDSYNLGRGVRRRELPAWWHMRWTRRRTHLLLVSTDLRRTQMSARYDAPTLQRSLYFGYLNTAANGANHLRAGKINYNEHTCRTIKQDRTDVATSDGWGGQICKVSCHIFSGYNIPKISKIG